MRPDELGQLKPLFLPNKQKMVHVEHIRIGLKQKRS